MSVDHLYQVDFDMLTHDFQTSLKVYVCSLVILSLDYLYSLTLPLPLSHTYPEFHEWPKPSP